MPVKSYIEFVMQNVLARLAMLALATIAATPASAQQAGGAPVIDRIVVAKSARSLEAYAGEHLVRTFRVALGFDPAGQKRQQGDGRTPEGVYPIVLHNPASAFHLSLRLGYPTPEQIADAKRRGVSAGGDIMIHGLPNGQGEIGAAHVEEDWTAGCIAVTNEEIEWLYAHTPDGALVDIRP